MRPLLLMKLVAGLPGWLAPTYFTLVVGCAVVALLIALRLAAHDGEDLRHEARSLAAGLSRCAARRLRAGGSALASPRR